MKATTTIVIGCILAVACSRAGDESSAKAPPVQTAAPETPGEQATAAPKAPAMPATLRAYRDVFLPIWNSQPATGRSKRACDEFSTLQKRAEAIDKQAPAGVDSGVWQRARESLTLCNESISEYCDDEDIATEDMAAEHLECIHKAVTELSALFAGAGASDMQGASSGSPSGDSRSSAGDARGALAAYQAAVKAAGDPLAKGSVKKACEAGLFKLAMRIDPDAAIPGVDPSTWRDAVTSLRQESEEFGANCGDDDPAVQSLARNLLRSIGETLRSLG